MTLKGLPEAAKELLRHHLASNTVTKWRITGDIRESVFVIRCASADSRKIPKKGEFRTTAQVVMEKNSAAASPKVGVFIEVRRRHAFLMQEKE